MIQQNASASEEMASTAEELSSQAEVLQSTIGFFRLDNGGTGAIRKPETLRSASNPGVKPSASLVTSSVSHLDRAVRSGGPHIELGAGTARADDRDFVGYQDER